MDDFDAPEVLAAAVLVDQAGVSGFEVIVPDWSLEPEEQRRLWQRAPVRKEMEKQLKLLDRIAALPWDEEDRRKRKGLAFGTPALGTQLAREVSWSPTDDAAYPWGSEVGGARWQGGCAFHDWPERWHPAGPRPGQRGV